MVPSEADVQQPWACGSWHKRLRFRAEMGVQLDFNDPVDRDELSADDQLPGGRRICVGQRWLHVERKRDCMQETKDGAIGCNATGAPSNADLGARWNERIWLHLQPGARDDEPLHG